MSLTYSIMEKLAKSIDLKKQFNRPEAELLRFIKTRYRTSDIPDRIYRRFRVEKILIDNRPVFRISSRRGKGGRAVLFVHGGGGMLCPLEFHYRMAERIVKNTDAVLYFPLYPLAPEHNLPQASAWLDRVWEYVLQNHAPDTVTVIGDSAGAGLGAALIARSDKMPHGLVMISPGTGVEKNDKAMRDLESQDIILSCKMLDIIKKYWGGGVDASSPDFCPTYIDYTGFCPIQLYYGTREIFYPHITELIDSINRSRTPLKSVEGKGLCHDWVIIGVFSESRRAEREICRFITE